MPTEKLCEVCNQPFKTIPSQIAKGGGRYCSNVCRNKARNHSITRNCEFCNKEFRVRPGLQQREGYGRFCSKSCAARALRPPAPLVTQNCEYCGIPFEIAPHLLKIGWGRYCSRYCRNMGDRSKVTVPCEVCGTMFEVLRAKRMKGEGRFCSKKCYGAKVNGENHHMWKGGTKTYRGPNWSAQRKAAYARDGGKCQICGKLPQGKEQKCHVHHIKAFRLFDPTDYLLANDLSNLITLCRSCHRRVELGKLATPKHLL